MSKRALPINYSIENMVRCIEEDNAAGNRYTEAEKMALYADCRRRVDANPKLKRVLSLSHVRNCRVPGAEWIARIGVLPPQCVVVDRRIKELCALPFWLHGEDKDGKPVKRFGKCPGYDFLPGCPPHSIPAGEVEERLKKADILVVLQTKLLSESGIAWKFRLLRRLASDIEKAAGKGAVVERYGSGPCGACKIQSCLSREPCASPALRTEALESMGISVDRICRDLAALTGQKAWEIRWIRHFGFREQTPKEWKYVMALGVRLPPDR